MSEFLSSLSWREPLWLLLALQPAILWLILRFLKNRNQQQFADEALLPWVKVQQERTFSKRVFSRDTAYVLAWIGFALALAGPRMPSANNLNPGETDLDVMLVVDISRSMHARDIKPSRIRRAVLETYEFLSLVKSARLGVVVYAARPHLYVPLTHDFDALKFYLIDMDTLQLPTQGSDSAAALAFAEKELQRSGKRKNQHLVWLTDGDFASNEINSLANRKKSQKAPTHIVGLGSSDGAAVPLSDGSWLESDGRAVVSKANFELLAETAQKWGGVFTIAADDESDWQKIYRQGILSQLKGVSNNKNINWKELYPWVLLPSILMFAIALFTSLKTILTLLGLSLLIPVGNIAKADERFNDNILEGAGSYESEDFSVAKAEFIQAVLNANSDKERAMALHNLGNSLFKIGDYQTALILFSDALRHDSDQIQSLHNHKLTYELYKLLQQRLQRQQMLRGPVTSASNEQNPLDLPEQIAYQLRSKEHTMDFKLPEIPETDKNKLIEKGLAHLELLQSNQQKNKQAELHQQKINQAKYYLNSLKEQNTATSSALWKRLFEIEEGFPAAIDEPKSIPGVRPW